MELSYVWSGFMQEDQQLVKLSKRLIWSFVAKGCRKKFSLIWESVFSKGHNFQICSKIGWLYRHTFNYHICPNCKIYLSKLSNVFVKGRLTLIEWLPDDTITAPSSYSHQCIFGGRIIMGRWWGGGEHWQQQLWKGWFLGEKIMIIINLLWVWGGYFLPFPNEEGRDRGLIWTRMGAYLIFVMSTTSSTCVNFFCLV